MVRIWLRVKVSVSANRVTVRMGMEDCTYHNNNNTMPTCKAP